MFLRRTSVAAVLVAVVALGVPVAASAQPPSCSVTASSSTVRPGESVTFTTTVAPDPIVGPYYRFVWKGADLEPWQGVSRFDGGPYTYTYEELVERLTVNDVSEADAAAGGLWQLDMSVDEGATVLCTLSVTLANVAPTPNPPPVPPPPVPATTGISLVLDFKVGDNIRAGEAGVPVSGSGLLPNADYTVVLRSDPVQIGGGVNDANGAFSATYPIPADTPGGSHSVTVSSLDLNGQPVTAVAYFTTDANGTVTAISYDGPTPDAPAVVPTPDAPAVVMPTFTG